MSVLYHGVLVSDFSLIFLLFKNNNIKGKDMQKRIIYITFLFAISIAFGCMPKSNKSTTPAYIVTSPEVAEIIVLLGAEDNIVGVTTECDYPNILQSKTKVGTFSEISYEKVVELSPTIVFASNLEQQKLASDLKKMGIRTEIIYSQSLNGMFDNISKIGELIGKSERAKLVVDSLQTELKKITDTAEFYKNKKVYIEIYGDPIMTVSDNSFVGNLVEIAGANNIFDSLPRDYSMVSAEKVIESVPEIMILTYPGMSKSDIKNRKGWSNIPAIKNGKIFTIEDINPDLILRATPRAILGMKKLQEIYND